MHAAEGGVHYTSAYIKTQPTHCAHACIEPLLTFIQTQYTAPDPPPPPPPLS